MTTYPFDLPSAASVRIESRLRPEQVSIAFTGVADLELDIATRIPRKADIVYSKLKRAAAPYQWPFTDQQVAEAYAGEIPTDIATDTQEQKDLATQATELYSLASLYGSAGQLNKAYFTRSTEYKDEADAVMANIIEGITFVKKSLQMDKGEPPTNQHYSQSVPVVAVWRSNLR